MESVKKRQHIIIFPGCLNFMSFIVSFYRCFMITGNIFMTGVKLDLSMGHPRTVSGAEDGHPLETMTLWRLFLSWRNMEFLPD